MDELDALWAFLVAAALAFGATPPVAALARRLGAVHQPRERDLHDKPVPRLGGLAILVAVVVAGVLFLPDERSTRAILIGAVAIALVGALDDYLPGGLPPLVKLAGQFGAAAIPVFAGDVRVENVTLPFVEPLPARRLRELPAVARRDRRGDERRELHRRRRRAGRRGLHDRRRHVRGDRAVARPRWTRRARGAHRRRGGGLPLAQLPPRVDLHGRRRLEPARAAARLRGDPGRAEDGRRGRARSSRS